jgi:hypothetical protein
MKPSPELSARDLERLSAYIDGQLEPAELTRLEARLRQEPHLRSELEELRATVQVLGELPRVRAPRSFAVREAPGRRQRGYPFLQLGTTLATLAFLVVVGLDVILARASSAALLADRQAALPAEQAAEAQAPAAQAAPALAAATVGPAATEAAPEEFAAAESAAPAPTAAAAAESAAPAPTGTPEPETLGYRTDDQAGELAAGETAEADAIAAAPPATGGEEPAAEADQVGALSAPETGEPQTERDRGITGSGSQALWRAAEIGLGVLALGLGGLTVRARRAY